LACFIGTSALPGGFFALWRLPRSLERTPPLGAGIREDHPENV